MKTNCMIRWLVIGLAAFACGDAVAKEPDARPTLADVHYGPHPKQVLDFYKADSPTPTPLVFNIHGGHAFGFTGNPKKHLSQFEEFLQERDKILPWIQEYSRFALASANDPPVYLCYSTPPAVGQAVEDPTHATAFGVKLQEKLRSVGVECCLAYPGATGVPYRGINEFFIAKLQAGVKGETKDARPARQVDFRYQPPTWQSAICMPDDPDKALAGKRGEFLDEYGVDNTAEPFALAIEHDLAGGSTWIEQRLFSPRVPIVQTRKQAGSVKIEEELFEIIPGKETTAAGATPLPLRRAAAKSDEAGVKPTPPEENRGWAKPEVPCDPAFTDVAVGWRGPLDYELRVPPGKQMKIVVGLCEGYEKQPGKRVLQIEVEGAPPLVVDPIKEAGHNRPLLRVVDGRDVDRNGVITIRIARAAGSTDPYPIVNALWAFEPERLPPPAEILSGEGQDRQYAFLRCGSSQLPYRQYILTARYTNEGKTPVRITPQIHVRATGIGYSAASGTIVASTRTCVRCSAAPQKFEKQPQRGVASLSAIELPPGKPRTVVTTIYRHGSTSPQAVSIEQAAALRAQSVRYWTEEARLPLGVIEVPDPGIQQLLDSAVRNIYQAREIKNGLPAFQVGPTVYRGLFIADGAFLLEAAAIVGRPEEARAGIDYFLSFQRDDGGIHVMDRYWKESGLTLWATTRQAMLAQDKEWLRQRWPKLKRIVAYIHALRQKESAADSKALDYRLHPGGLVDGGVYLPGCEFSNTYWSLAGLRAVIQAAHWLGDAESARAWQAEYDDFYAAFRRAAERELRVDRHGNRYLPVVMGPKQPDVPQRGQWSFCHAVYPGQLFAKDDPIVSGTLNMLRATECEGLVLDTGWVHGGIWNYFASFYGHALLWQGDGPKAVQVLYDFANHACPVLDWWEEQVPRGKGEGRCGDMPHNWASAEFIRLTVHLLALDRGDELHLLEGLPREWTRPGMVTRLNGVCTPFGPLHLELRVASDGKTARLQARVPGTACKAIVVHLSDWASREGGAVRTFPADRPIDVTIPILGHGA